MSEFNIEYKPKRVDHNIPYGFRKLDNETVSIPIPKRIAGQRVNVLKHKFHKVAKCQLCGLPAVWYDQRIKNQYNECEQCGAIHQMILNNYGHVKGRLVENYPQGYLDKRPFKIKVKR